MLDLATVIADFAAGLKRADAKRLQPLRPRVATNEQQPPRTHES